MTQYLQLIFSSMLIGLSIAAPVGPIGVLCIRRTLVNGRWHGLASGLGAASADGFYGFIAAFGLTAISSLLIDSANVLRLFGGAFLLYLGVRTLLARPSDKAAEAESSGSLWSDYASTLVLTMTNPMTILAFLGIFAGIGADTLTQDRFSAVLMVLGVFLGSALWWLALSGLVSLLRERINANFMLWVNRISGAIIILFAIGILWELVTSFL